ncbi:MULTISPECIES: protein TolR [unclassified Wenzhouxiangella]|uniref:protein TolR n=1 Tax=unclassified Wenzhouxiangella TaxID=2613841 RepID=UPI000E329715|nr:MULTISPECIES: protein TolR [unclassified Wenzhouxiangella]RFF28196.1 protein TolR [Wenzhouxiangella sp. 15181]RFP67936.1 protein TolR [Wenzhouxiangella sp. 15190]
MSDQPYIRRRRKRMSEINVVPYIDVMLVLLIIFMVTAPLMNQGVEVELPTGQAEPLTDQGDPLMVTVTAEGDLYLDTGDAAELVDEQTLVETVSAIVARNPQLQVTVTGDRDVDYQHIYGAMVLLQRAGVASVGLVGDPEPESE